MSWKQQRATALATAQDIINRAKAASRELTADEQTEVEAKFAEIETIDRSVKDGDALIAKLNSFPVVDHEEIGEAKFALALAVRTKQSRQVSVSRKALGTTGLNLPAVGTDTIGAAPGTAATSLRDLFPTQTVETPLVRYYTVARPTGSPAVVAEGALKPEMTHTVTPKDEPIVKLAGRFTLTTELVADAESVVQEVFRQALLEMLRAENKLVLDRMSGASGVVVTTGAKADALDVIAAAIGTQEAVNGLRPDAIVMNPADLAAVRSLKAAGSGSYLVGDPLAAGPATVWGVPVMSTPALAAGTAWLARKDAGVFYERSGVEVTSGLVGDDLIHNRVTTVVEERCLPVITQPGLLTKITLTA